MVSVRRARSARGARPAARRRRPGRAVRVSWSLTHSLVRNLRAGWGLPTHRTEFLATARQRIGQLAVALLLIAQSALATSMAWLLATTFIGNSAAVFAPVTALVTLAMSLARRLRGTVELVLGVALGVFLGDLLVLQVGKGVWQLALIVSISMIVAILLGGGPTFTIQAAATGVIIATVTPASDLLFSRMYDVLIGAAVGLLVGTVLLPLNPIMVARRGAHRVLDELAEALADLAEALRAHAHAPLRAAVEQIRAVEEGPLGEFVQATEIATETARLAPFRWRVRYRVEPYQRVVERLNHVMRNLRVLTRRSRALLGQGEQVPPGLVEGLDRVSGAVRLLLDDLLAERDPERARAELVRGVRATADVPTGLSISAQVVVGQLRSTAVDLLRACGLSYREADELVRRAVTEPRLRPGQGL